MEIANLQEQHTTEIVHQHCNMTWIQNLAIAFVTLALL